MTEPATPVEHHHVIDISTRTLFVVLAMVGGVWLLGKLTTVLSVLTIALVLVGTFDPVVGWLERRGLGRGRSLAIVFAVAALLLAALVLAMVPPLFAQILHLIEGAPAARANLLKAAEGHSWAKPFVSMVRDLRSTTWRPAPAIG